jgi:hypothetical protein
MRHSLNCTSLDAAAVNTVAVSTAEIAAGKPHDLLLAPIMTAICGRGLPHIPARRPIVIG